MIKKASTLMAVLLAFGVLSGCSKAKEAALVGLDEARLKVSSARKAGAEQYAKTTMNEAMSKLNIAEKNFKKGNYGFAQKQAQEASNFADKAKSEAIAKAAAKSTAKKKTRSKNTRR